MYNREAEFKNIIHDANDIPAEIEMENVKKIVKKKAFRHRITSVAGNTAIACMLVVVIFIVGVNVSPAFAETMSNIPFLKKMAQSVAFNEGYKDAVENEYITKVEQSKKTKFGDIKLSYYIADKKNALFFFEAENIQTGVEKENLWLFIQSIKNTDTGEEYDSISGTCPDFKDEYAVADLGLWPKEFEYPEHMEITVKVYNEENTEFITYNLTMAEPLEERVYNVNRQIEIREQKITIDKVTVYPTCTYVEYSEDESNTMDVMDIDFHLVDGEGVERGSERTITYIDDNGITIASGYFALGDDIHLVLDKLNLLPKDKRKVTYNIKTKEFSDCDGVLDYIYTIQNKELLEDYGIGIEKYRRAFIIDRPEVQTSFNSFSEIDDKTGEFLDTWFGAYANDDITIYTMPKSIEKDKDGTVTLWREFAEYFETPDIEIPIK